MTAYADDKLAESAGAASFHQKTSPTIIDAQTIAFRDGTCSLNLQDSGASASSE